MIITVGGITNAQNVNHLLSITNELKAPSRFAVDANNLVYVTDTYKKCINVYDGAGNFFKSINVPATPVSIAISPQNDIVVGDAVTGKIFKIDADGQITKVYTDTELPSDMVFDADGLLYIVDCKLKQLLVVDLQGNLIRIIGQDIIVAPSGIAYDETNNRIVVAEHGGVGGNIQNCGSGMLGSWGPVMKLYFFDLQGSLISSIGCFGNDDGVFDRVQGITIDKCGNIYVCDPFQGNINIFDANGNYMTKFGEFGKELGRLNLPLDIVLTSQHQAWVTSTNNGALEVFDVNLVSTSAFIENTENSICEGGIYDINVDLTGTPPWSIEYTHNGTNPITVYDITESPYILKVSDEGKYEITGMTDAENTGTCYGGATNITITPLPTAYLHNDDVDLCDGDTFNLTFELTGVQPWDLTYTIDGTNPVTINGITQNSFSTPVNDAGTYSISKLLGNACEGFNFSGETEIEYEPTSTADFSYTFLENTDSLEVHFYNNSLNSDSYLWDFGDGNTSAEINPTHTYINAGIFNVTLTSTNGYCGDSKTEQTINLVLTNIDNLEFGDIVKIYPNPSSGKINIETTDNDMLGFYLEIENITGEKIYNKIINNPVEQIDLSEYSAGLYIIKLISKEHIQTKKIILK